MTQSQIQAMIQRVAALATREAKKESVMDPTRFKEFVKTMFPDGEMDNPDRNARKKRVSVKYQMEKDPSFKAHMNKAYESWLAKVEDPIEAPDDESPEEPEPPKSKESPEKPTKNEWDEDQPTNPGAPKSKEHPEKPKGSDATDDEMTQEEAEKSHAEADAKAHSMGYGGGAGFSHSKSKAEHKRRHENLDKAVAADLMPEDEFKESLEKLHEKARSLGYRKGIGASPDGEDFTSVRSRKRHQNYHDELDQEIKNRPPAIKRTVYQPPKPAPQEHGESATPNAPEHPEAEADPETATSEAAGHAEKAEEHKPADTTKKEEAEADTHLNKSTKEHKDSWMKIKEQGKKVDELSNMTDVLLGESPQHKHDDRDDEPDERSDLTFTDNEGNTHESSPSTREQGLEDVTHAHGFRDSELDLIRAHIPENRAGSTEDRVAAMLAHLKSLKTKDADRAHARLERMDAHKADAFIDALHGREPTKTAAMIHRVANRYYRVS